MPALRYRPDDMPADLAAIARRNLVTEDVSIARFNDRAKWFPTQVNVPKQSVQQPQPVQRSSFQFNLGGQNDTSQLGLGPPQTTGAVSGGGSLFKFTDPNKSSFTADAPSFTRNSVMESGHVGDTFSDTPHEGQGVILHPWETGYSDESRRRGVTSSAPAEHREQYGWGQ